MVLRLRFVTEQLETGLVNPQTISVLLHSATLSSCASAMLSIMAEHVQLHLTQASPPPCEVHSRVSTSTTTTQLRGTALRKKAVVCMLAARHHQNTGSIVMKSVVSGFAPDL